MNQREKAIICEVSDIISAVQGVSNPADMKGKSLAYEELEPIRSRASVLLDNLCNFGASDSDTTDGLELLRQELRKVPRDHLRSFIVERHPEWFGDSDE